jgi:hypothetical protein
MGITHLFITICRGLSSFRFLITQQEKDNAHTLSEEPPWGARPGFEPGTVFQQSDQQLTELDRALTKLRLTLTELQSMLNSS